MTPQVWPIRVGKIKLKTRVGPKSDLVTKTKMRQCAKLVAAVSSRSER